MGKKLSIALAKVVEARGTRTGRDESVFRTLAMANELIRA